MQTFAQRHRTKSLVFWLPCQSKDVLCVCRLLFKTERNGTEQNGTRLNGTERTRTESKTTQLCWNINDQVFNQSVFVCMIFNDKHEAIARKLLPRDTGQKASYFGCLANPQMSSVFVYHYLKQNGTERNETERNGTDWN